MQTARCRLETGRIYCGTGARVAHSPSPAPGCKPDLSPPLSFRKADWRGERGLEKCDFSNLLENKENMKPDYFDPSIEPVYFRRILMEYKNGISSYNFSSLELPA